MPLRRYSEAEVILSERRRLEMPLLVTVWLGVLAFCLAEGTVFYAVAATAAVGVNAWAVRRRHEVYVQRAFVNIGVLLATVVLVIELLGPNDGMLRPLGHYLILIQLCKLFERKGNRDYVQLLAMSGLLTVVASILSSALAFALVVLVYLGALCYTSMVFTLKRGLDAVGRARLDGEQHPLSPRLLAWNAIRDWPGAALRRRLGVLLAAILATGAVMFLVTPRTGRGLGGQSGARRPAQGGFPSQIRLGEPGEIYLSDAIVMRVTVAGAEPVGVPRYFRGRTFEVYADSTWSTSPAGPPRYAAAPVGETVVQDVEMNASLLPTLFAIAEPIRCDAAGGTVQFDAANRMTLTQRRHIGKRVDYRVWSLPPDNDEAVARLERIARTPAAGDDPTEGVEITPRVDALAERWAGDLARRRDATQRGPRRDRLDVRIAERIADKLAERCAYTLDLSDAEPDRDAVEDFLFHLRKGHCEYFAAAQVVLCRALGVRARLAGGFRSDGAADGRHVLRGRDAHAWAEVYTPSTHWRIVDPAPRRRLDPPRAWHAPLTGLWRNVQTWWRERVVGYDADARRRTGRWFADVFAAIYAAAAGVVRSVVRSVVNLLAFGVIDRAMRYVVAAVTFVAAVVLAAVIGRVVRRELRYRRHLRHGVALPWQTLRFFARLMRLLERHGIERRDDRTPRELTDEAARRLDLPADALDDLVDLYYRLRWGHATVSLARVRAAEQQVADLAE
ncbi:MAG: DUF3488 domain-containing protein, partial [Phycisphaerae bacterium]|nr:DUF3488 domain-containing protein [Phycisphaerae bacterium]